MAWLNLAVRSRALPRQPSAKAGGAALTLAAAPARRILVIDDDPVARLVLTAALRESGYDVAEAGDGGEGLALFRSCPADLVVTDIVMPLHDGLETVQALRAAAPGVWIVVVSGVTGGAAEHMRTAVRLGADRVLPKPVNPGELIPMVAGLIARGQRP